MHISSTPPRAATRRLVAVGVALAAASLVVPSALAGSSSQDGHGLLSINTSPVLPSVITVDGIARNATAISGLELPAGDVEIAFSNVDGYLAPPAQRVTVQTGRTTEIVGEFLPAGKIHVQTQPAGLDPVVVVNDVERDRGTAELWLEVGPHTVCGSELAGYSAPDCTVINIKQGSVSRLTLNYESTENSVEVDKGAAGEVSVARHGITWTFDGEHSAGQYANGDWWVVGPVTITEIDPGTTIEGWHGSMVNPSPRDAGNIGYGPVHANTYVPDLNVATKLPLMLQAGSSLVSTIGKEDSTAVPGIETAAVLTVVDQPPPQGAFRPPYSGTDKTSYFTESDLRYDSLPRLARVAGAPDPAEIAGNFERVWLDHRGTWSGRKIHPASAMPNYGRNLTARLGEGFLTLVLDYSDESKHPLLVNLVQIGIDFHGIVEDGGEENWIPDGGHAQGRKLPILFAGHILGDPTMLDIGQRDEVFFGEDAQTFYVSQAEVDLGVGYTSSDIGMPEWAIRYATHPTNVTPDWERSYRQCCTANSWHGHVLTARVLGLQEAWNHDALFDYTDRFMEIQKDTDSWKRSWDRPFSENMWDTYRSRY